MGRISTLGARLNPASTGGDTSKSVVKRKFSNMTELLASTRYTLDDYGILEYVAATRQLYFLADPVTQDRILVNGGADTGEIVVYHSGSNSYDATTAVQNILASSPGVISLKFLPGKNYNFSAPLTLPLGTTIVHANGAMFTAQFGNQYSTPLFQNNKSVDQTHSLVVNNPVIRGNCVAFDMRYQANNPGAGMSLSVNNVNHNSMDGNRRAGTALMLLSHIDFLDIVKIVCYNVDQLMYLGAAPPKRNSTQLTIRNVMAGQVNGGVIFRGCDKVDGVGIDIANCNNGFSFEGNNTRISLLQCHVEGLGRTGYNTKSTYNHASAEGVGYNFVQDTDNKVMLRQCSIIDLGTTGGTAKHGVRLDASNYPGIVDIEFDNCRIPETCEGSATFKPARFHAPMKWRGDWTFTNTSEMSQNGLGYIDHDVTDSDNNFAPRTNLIGGTTIMSLRTYSGGTAPTITEVAQNYNPMYLSHRIVFNSAGFLRSAVNLPIGWCTLDVVGQRIAGNVLLRVEQNGAPFTQLVNVQYKSLNNTFHRTRIVFWNPTPNQSYNVGLAAQNATGDESVFSYIACYAGLPDVDIRNASSHLMGVLPTPSIRWARTQVIVVTTGAEDAIYHCLLQSDGTTWIWRKVTLT
jgi:hypothetical protein